MKKNKWIIGLSLLGIFAVSGTALAFTPGVSTVAAQTLGFNSRFGTFENSEASNLKTTAFNTKLSTTPSTSTVEENSTGLPSQNGYGGMMGAYNSPNYQGGNYGGYGMIGGYGGSGMMGGNGTYGMMGSNGGYGMMGRGDNAASLGVNLPNGQVTSDDQVQAIADAYLKVQNGNFSIDEIHEFSDSYEVELNEATTDKKAFEFLIYKNGGYISTEMGPNVMWNTQYGHMNWGNNGALTITTEQATQAAQNFVKEQMGAGYSVEAPEIVPGYYEFMVLKDNKDYAELDVNGYTGQLWFENWHGPIIKTIEAK